MEIITVRRCCVWRGEKQKHGGTWMMIVVENESFDGETGGNFRPRGCALYRRNYIMWKRGTNKDRSVSNAAQKWCKEREAVRVKERTQLTKMNSITLRYVSMAVKIWIVVFWVTTPCRLVRAHQCFEGAYRLHLQDRKWRCTGSPRSCEYLSSWTEFVKRVAISHKQNVIIGGGVCVPKRPKND
jgi:hypothetical protein